MNTTFDDFVGGIFAALLAVALLGIAGIGTGYIRPDGAGIYIGSQPQICGPGGCDVTSHSYSYDFGLPNPNADEDAAVPRDASKPPRFPTMPNGIEHI